MLPEMIDVVDVPHAADERGPDEGGDPRVLEGDRGEADDGLSLGGGDDQPADGVVGDDDPGALLRPGEELGYQRDGAIVDVEQRLAAGERNIMGALGPDAPHIWKAALDLAAVQALPWAVVDLG